MALRDPGPPRRNPLFAVDEPPGGPPADAPESSGSSGSSGSSEHHDGWDDWADDPIFGGADDPLLGAPGSAVGPLLNALTEAGPEAAEHLVNAAHELTLAVKVVVDAFERSLAEQRAAFAAEPDAGGEPRSADDDEFELDLDLEGPPFSRPAAPRVQNIDLE
jgi:hypothetical protein